MPNQKMEAVSSLQQKDKMADGSGFPSPLIFWEKGVVAYISRKCQGLILDKNYAKGTKQYFLNTKQQITLKFND